LSNDEVWSTCLRKTEKIEIRLFFLIGEKILQRLVDDHAGLLKEIKIDRLIDI
jgi:hypothetical protein